jgi:hypothetical protein
MRIRNVVMGVVGLALALALSSACAPSAPSSTASVAQTVSLSCRLLPLPTVRAVVKNPTLVVYPTEGTGCSYVSGKHTITVGVDVYPGRSLADFQNSYTELQQHYTKYASYRYYKSVELRPIDAQLLGVDGAAAYYTKGPKYAINYVYMHAGNTTVGLRVNEYNLKNHRLPYNEPLSLALAREVLHRIAVLGI